MNFRNLAVLCLLAFYTSVTFAQDGGDRTHQRLMEFQQAYLAAERQKAADKDAEITGAQDHTHNKEVKTPATAG